jgi:hypothetical protein
MRDHRFGKVATVIALAGVALLAASTTAQASTADSPVRTYAAAAGCPSLNPSVPKAGSITIDGSVATGVVHLADGNCAHGAYDVILKPGQDTFHTLGWKEAAFAYVGSGYDWIAWYVNDPSTIYYNTTSCPCWVGNMNGGNLVVEPY